MEDVPNNTNHDVSGATGASEAETNTKPSGEYDPYIKTEKMIYFKL